MKPLAAIIFLLLSFPSIAVEPDESLNERLIPIYKSITSSQNKSIIEGKEFSIDLHLKFASRKYLIFSDAYLRLDDETKYQIAKWKFSPEIIRNIDGKSDIIVKVTFIVTRIENTGAYKAMPNIVAMVTNINSF